MAHKDHDDVCWSFYIESENEAVIDLPRGRKIDSMQIQDMPGVPVQASNYQDETLVEWYFVKTSFWKGDRLVLAWSLPAGVQKFVRIVAY